MSQEALTRTKKINDAHSESKKDSDSDFRRKKENTESKKTYQTIRNPNLSDNSNIYRPQRLSEVSFIKTQNIRVFLIENSIVPL